MNTSKRHRVFKLLGLIMDKIVENNEYLFSKKEWVQTAILLNISTRTLYRYVDLLISTGHIKEKTVPEGRLLHIDKTICNVLTNSVSQGGNLSISKYTTIKDTPITPTSRSNIGLSSTVGASSTSGLRSTIGPISTSGLTYEIVNSLKTKQEEFKMREPNTGPKLPTTASEVADEPHTFPYVKQSVQASAIWYWAIQRFKKHGLDFHFTGAIFGKLGTKYHKGVVKRLGTDWAKHEEYINWFINSYDSFVRDTTKYGIDFLCSTSCLNKFEERDFGKTTIVESDEDRLKYKGTWIQ